MKGGKFITLEGIEGVGKSTHVEYIATEFRQHGHTPLLTREPGGTRTGEAIREILLHGKDLDISPRTELILMFAARAQHLQEVILPALADGVTVICDRFTDASYAYQGGGRGISDEEIALLEKYVQQGLAPDLTLLFDASVETGQQRAGQRSAADRFESEAVGFFKRVRQTYLQRAEAEPERIRVIDAEQTIEQVENQISRILTEVMW
ncbi:MAG: dTMP kinase [Gammaproteobacteria bacterium]